MTIRNILVAGAGKIGSALARMLTASGDYLVRVVDMDEGFLKTCPVADDCHVCDLSDADALKKAMQGCEAVISAAPFFLSRDIAKAAIECGLHYFDLTEDVQTTAALQAMAKDADTAVMPQCGLAPGFVCVTANHLANRFEKADVVKMRVGALPQFPSNRLKYNLTWSTDGLINEYCNLCETIHEGRVREVLPLDGLEEFSFDGIDYEAFNTSGGVGTLCETLRDKVNRVNYKTVRYPGHCEIAKLLVRDLRLSERRDLLKDVFENAIPVTLQDVVLIFVTASGWKGGRLMQETFARKIYSQDIDGVTWSAIQRTTSAGVCTMVDLLNEGKLPSKGFVRQEDAKLEEVLSNRFGKCFA